jgi:tetratricopeptide (TPR) repeat protein
MVTERGRVKIMDFGLAKFKGATKITSTGSTLGTLSYMSPEQAQGGRIDQRSDIFSFGVVLYELLTGRLPFESEHEAGIVYAIVNEEPQPVARYNSQVPEDLERIVYKALAKNRDERYQHVDDLLADLRRVRKDIEYAKEGRVTAQVQAARPKRSHLPYSIPALVILAAVVLFLVFKPFGIEFTPEKEAIAQENTLAVMYFENLAESEDSQRLGEIITSLLIADLSESQYVNVVSSQRLYDILKQLGKEGVTKIDRSVASQVAEKAKAKWMLLGSLLQTEPEMVLMSQLVDVSTGNVVASQRITAGPEEQIFAVVDRLTVELKKDLALPEQARTEEDPHVADVTTHSPEAYRHYVEGVAALRKVYMNEAEQSFKEALEFDSTFAMAYISLAVIEWWNDGEEVADLAAKAMKYSENKNRREWLLAKSLHADAMGDLNEAIARLEEMLELYPGDKEAYYTLGMIYEHSVRDLELAEHYYLKAIEADPMDKTVYNLLAYLYDNMGNVERSLWAINKYIEIAPDEANPYDSRGDLYAMNGNIDDAIASYEKALEIKPDFYESLKKLGHMHLYKGDYAEAERHYQTLCSVPDKWTRSLGRTYLAFIAMYQGRFAESMAILDEGIAADRMEDVGGGRIFKHSFKAYMYLDLGQPQDALNEMDKAMKIYDETYGDEANSYRVAEIHVLARAGEITRAEERLAAFIRDTDAPDPQLDPLYWYAAGVLEVARGNGVEAARYFSKGVEHMGVFLAYYRVGESYLLAGRLADAVTALEEAAIKYDSNRITGGLAGVKVHYLLGQAYEESGWTDKAIQQYETFLSIAYDPDPGILPVEDAKQRLERLKAQS